MSFPNKKFGKAVIGYGGVNFIMNPGARRIAVPLVKSCGCSPACQGSPFFGMFFKLPASIWIF